MEPTFRCIRCDRQLPRTEEREEHVFPVAIGGQLRLRCVCKRCNDGLGSGFDAPLVNHLLIQFKRKHFGLAGRSGAIPDPLRAADAWLANNKDVRVRLDAGGLRVLPSKIRSDGSAPERIVVDARDREKMDAIVATIAQRRGVRPQTSVEAHDGIFESKLEMPWLDWIFGVVKIAYELAYTFLGRSYLDDPLGRRFRSFLELADPTVDALVASNLPLQPRNVGELDPFEGLEEHHHYGSIFLCPRGVGCEVRIFETLGLNAIVSETPERYKIPGGGVAVLHDVQVRKVAFFNAETRE